MTIDNEYIDQYFSGSMPAEEKQIFEKRIQSDESFAEDVAFYVSAMAVARESGEAERKEKLRELYEVKTEQKDGKIINLGWLKPVMSAAAVLLIFFLGWTFFLKPASVQQLADEYIKNKFSEQPVQMGKSEDSIEIALGMFNKSEFEEAGKLADKMLISNPADPDALKLTGIVSLRLGNYDKALISFQKIADQPGLFSNMGLFYKAITLMKRDRSGDRENAKQLLKKVVEQKLGGNEIAEEWLNKMD